MVDFKFFQKERKIQTTDSHLILRDQYNRQKVQFIRWSEYPDSSTILLFEGNILEFSNHIKHQRFLSANPLREITPTIYEIGMFRSGYFSQSYGFSTRQNMIPFISRKWKLRIYYNI